jgi:probable phosphoglycerate mutase
VSTVLLVRHGLTTQTGPLLSGWTPGIDLDERGRSQATALAERIKPIPIAAIVCSPLERCVQTAEAIRAVREPAPPLHLDERLGEVRYGDWTGRELRALAKEPLWRTIQAHPSAATFPNGESLRAMAARAIEAIRDWNERLGAEATYLVVSHADVIKALVADALGVHLDGYQRIVVDPCSLSAIRYTEMRPFLLRCNDTGGSVDAFLPQPKRRRRRPRPDDG